MPATDKKPNRRSSGDQKKVVKQPTNSVYDVTVKECLVWPSSMSDSNPKADSGYMSLRSQKQLKDDLDTKQQDHARIIPRDDGTAIEALRGWPRHRERNPEPGDDLEQLYSTHYNDLLTGDPVAKQPTAKQGGKFATRKSGSSKSFKRVVVKEPDDVHVGDLIAQRYLHEYAERRRAEEETERAKSEATDHEAKFGRRAAKDRRDVKANKAAQLRAIALADRVESDPLDLWKMERFTKNARPHLSTFRNGSGGGRRRSGDVKHNRGSISAMDSDHFDHGPCMCPDKPPFFYGEIDFDDVTTNRNDGDVQLQSLTNACDSFTL